MKTHLPRSIPAAVVLATFVLASGCQTTEEKCQDAKDEARHAWHDYSVVLRARPELSQERLNAQLDREYERYDAECRRLYGIDDPDSDMSQHQAVGLIACRMDLPRVDLHDWPSSSAASQLAESAHTEDLEVFTARLELFKEFEGRMVSYGPDHRRAYRAADELVATCAEVTQH